MNQLNNDRYWKEFKLPDLEINSYGTPTLHYDKLRQLLKLILVVKLLTILHVVNLIMV